MGFEKEMVEYLPYPAILLDASYQIKYANSQFQMHFQSNLAGNSFIQNCLNRNSSSDLPDLMEKHFLESPLQPYYADGESCPKPGSKKLVRWRIHKLQGADAPYAYFVFVDPSLDSTTQEKYFQTTMSSIGDGLISTDSQGHVLYMNPVAEKMCGWNLVDAQEKDISTVFNIVNAKTRRPAEDVVRKVLKSGMLSGLANDTLLISKDGSERQIADTAAPISDGSGIAGVVLVFRDVTADYLAARNIKESEERFRSIIQSMPLGVHLYRLEEDNRLIFTGANKTADKMLGVDNSLFVGKTIEEAFPPLSQTPIPEIYRNVARTGESWSTEQVDYDDKRIRGAYQVSAFRFMPMAVTVMFLDISERKRAEQELQASESKFRQISENIQDGIIIIQDGKFTYRNRRTESIFGDCPNDGEKCMEHFLSFFDPQDQKRIESFFSGSSAPISDLFDAGFWITRPDKSKRFIIIRSSVNPEPCRTIYLFISDMTDWANLMKERNYLYDYSIDMLCVAGFDGYFKQLNPAWSRTLGWDEEEILSKPWLEFVHPDDIATTKAAATQLGTGEPVIMFENRYICKNGLYKWLSWSSFPLTEENVIFSVVRDVTRQKEMEENIRQSEKMESIGKLAGGIAHDFNNQLAAIIGCVDILNNMIRKDPSLEQIKEFVEMIANSAQRSAQLTGQLLAFARKGKYQSTPIDIRLLTNEIISILSRTIDKKISVQQKSEAVDYYITGDPTQIQNALLNICLNARDAMPNGGTLTISTRNENGSLVISISDTGIGMDGETLKHAFEPFFTTKPKGQGTGLGLSAVDGIMRTHGGTIDIQSAIGNGTTMTLRFPTVQPPLQQTEETVLQQKKNDHQGHILIIDDEPLIGKVAGKLLESCGYSVSIFNDSQQAINSFPHLNPAPQVVILDMIMPGMNGTEVFRKIRSLNPETRIIISSGYSMNDETQNLIKEGAVAFLQKPFLKAQLEETVEKAIKGY